AADRGRVIIHDVIRPRRGHQGGDRRDRRVLDVDPRPDVFPRADDRQLLLPRLVRSGAARVVPRAGPTRSSDVRASTSTGYRSNSHRDQSKANALRSIATGEDLFLGTPHIVAGAARSVAVESVCPVST